MRSFVYSLCGGFKVQFAALLLKKKKKLAAVSHITLSEKQLECRIAFELRMDLFSLPRQSASVFLTKRRRLITTRFPVHVDKELS